MKSLVVPALAAMGLFVAMPAVADNWDQAFCNLPGCNDSFPTTTTNELVHGSSQIHDLDDNFSGLVDDEDWYFVSQKPYSSYEVIVDGTTPFLNRTTPVLLALVDSSGTIQTTDYATSSKGFTRSLRFANTTASAVDTDWARVSAAADCGGGCIPIDQYSIRMYETTYFIPRYNNSGTQTTVMIVQNPTDFSTGANVYFWNATGTLVGSTSATIPARGTVVLNTSTVPGVAGTGGSVTIAHNNRYGSLTGKAVAVEPATGFTFDTQMVAHP
jgi:hypothetical protein